MAAVQDGPRLQLGGCTCTKLATHWPTRGRSGQVFEHWNAAGVRTHNRAVAEADESAGEPPEPGDWRTSPSTGELEFYDGRAWVRSGPPSGGSEVLIRPIPPAEEPPGAEDAADPA